MESQRAAIAAITGFFVDWTGVTRSVSNPGASYKFDGDSGGLEFVEARPKVRLVNDAPSLPRTSTNRESTL
jgi:hypothetical protein